MKWLLVLLFIGSTAIADTETVLKECSITCSARCKDYALEIKKMADDILDNCGSGSGSKAAIIDACSHAGFSYQSDIQTCISTASYAADVTACAHSGFSYQSQILECIKSN